MAGSKDRIQESPEWIAARNALISPVRELLHLSAQRREQRDQLAQVKRHEMAQVAQKYPDHEEQIIGLYAKVYGVQRSIADGNTVVAALVTEGIKNVFREVKDADARLLLSFYYASNVLHKVHEAHGTPTLESTYAMRQDALQGMTQALGVESTQDNTTQKVDLERVIDTIVGKGL